MASYQYIYVMQGLRKAFPGGREVVKDVTLAFLPGAKIGVLGVNGAGKSTLLKIMAGLDTEYTGEARVAEGATVGYLPQEPDLDADKDVFGNVLEGMKETHDLLQEFEEISNKFAEPMEDDEMNALIERQGELQEKIDAVDGWELERTVEIAMDALRCPPGDADVTKLSGGERRRVALCRLLLQKPDLLLLDEPTNHLDAESVAWLERFLDDYPGTVVAVTHDRYFLDNVAGWILELDRGQGAAVRRQLLVLAGTEGKAPCAGRARGIDPSRRRWRVSWNGCGPRRVPGRPRARRASRPMSISWRRPGTRRRPPRRSSFQPVNGSAIW